MTNRDPMHAAMWAASHPTLHPKGPLPYLCDFPDGVPDMTIEMAWDPRCPKCRFGARALKAQDLSDASSGRVALLGVLDEFLAEFDALIQGGSGARGSVGN